MSHEDDLAFLEDYRFMLDTGESHATAAARFGVSSNTLERRVYRARLRVAERSISPAISARIRDGAEGSYLLDADPLTELAESRIA